MQILNLIIASTRYNFCVETDEHRIRTAERAMTKEAEETRRQQTSARKVIADEYINVNCMMQTLQINGESLIITSFLVAKL